MDSETTVFNKSFALASQNIKKIIGKHLFTSKNFKNRIQPSSFDTSTENYLFILDSEETFRPSNNKTILSSLKEKKVKKVNISKGFELKKGFSYIVPLKESLKLNPFLSVKSSPKSSLGRLFLNTRLISDFNPSFDEVLYDYVKDRKLKLYLLIQPLTFNIILYPDISLTQLRFFHKKNFRFNDEELEKYVKHKPFLFDYDSKTKKLFPSKHITSNGIILHLDLKGKKNSVVALKAKPNPVPVDLKKFNHKIEDYFKKVYSSDGSLIIHPKEYYLLSSKEVLQIYDDIAAELKTYSHVSLQGPLHFAGFIDNGFIGDLVLEVRSDEVSPFKLVDGMPIGKLEFFKTPKTKKVYGKNVKSNYFKQVGPKPSKYFINDLE